MQLFHERPFYTTPDGVEQRLNTRLYRPVEDIQGSQALDEFYDRTARSLRAAGFRDGDTTLLSPPDYEVTIISKGSINVAVTKTPNLLLRNAREQTIQDVLLEGLPGSAKRPIPAVIEKIGVYGSEQDESNDVRYLAAFLGISDENMKLYVGIERYSGYDNLRVLSDMDQVFASKLSKLKPAAFRFAAFHGSNNYPTKELIASLMPKGLLNVILGKVRADEFKD